MLLRTVLLGSVIVAGLVSSARAATPTLMWRDVSRVAVQCLVQPTTDSHRALQGAMCDRVRAFAARGAPVPVTVIAQGDPAVLAPGTVTLLVHASVQPAGRNRLVAFSIRPFRVSADQNAVLFGAAPRAAVIPASGAITPALDAALRAAVAETTPWLARPVRPQAIN